MKRWDAGDWFLFAFIIAAIGMLVWFVVWSVGSARESNQALYDCQAAGYVTTVWFGDVGVCVGADVGTGEYVAVSVERVRAGTEGR